MRCDLCRKDGPTRFATFSRTAGFVIGSSFQTLPGNLCTSCLKARYESFNTSTAFFGWWSISSFPRAIVYLAANAKEYRRAMSADPLSQNPTVEELESEQVRQWRAVEEQRASRLFIWGALSAIAGAFLIVGPFVTRDAHTKTADLTFPVAGGVVFLLVGAGMIAAAYSKRNRALHGAPPQPRARRVVRRAKRRR